MYATDPSLPDSPLCYLLAWHDLFTRNLQLGSSTSQLIFQATHEVLALFWVQKPLSPGNLLRLHLLYPGYGLSASHCDTSESHVQPWEVTIASKHPSSSTTFSSSSSFSSLSSSSSSFSFAFSTPPLKGFFRLGPETFLYLWTQI